MNPIIYNVTVLVDHNVAEEWKSWMTKIHIPDVMKTGFFTEFKFSKVIQDPQEGGDSYAIQYVAKSMSALNEYQLNHAPALQKEHTDKYGEKCLAFRTLLEILDAD